MHTLKLTLSVITFFGLACGNAGLELDSPRISGGEYQATKLTTTQGNTTLNQLDRGAHIELTLGDDGSTSGDMFVPGGLDGTGEDIDVDLSGSWAFDEQSREVDLDLDANTFLEEIPLTPLPRGTGVISTLQGEGTFQDISILVKLDRAVSVSRAR